MRQQQKSVPRLFLLHIPLIVLGGGIFLFLVGTLGNQLSSSLDAKTQAWLHYPLPTAKSQDNSYVALLALDSRRPDSVAAGLELESAFHRMEQEYPQPSEDQYNAQRQKILPAYAVPVPKTFGCHGDCVEFLAGHRAEIIKALQTYSERVAKFDALMKQPAYAEAESPQKTLLTNYHAAMYMDLLYLGRTFYTLDDGKAAQAYSEWRRHQEFWLRTARGSVSAVGLMIALEQLKAGDRMLVIMMASHPETQAIAREEALPVLEAGQDKMLKDQFARVGVYEFHNFDELLRGLALPAMMKAALHPEKYETKPTVSDYIALPLLNYEKTLNEMREMLEDSLATAGLSLDGVPFTHYPALASQCAHRQLTDHLTLDNPTGDILVCLGSHSAMHYVKRIDMVGAFAASVRQTLVSTGSAADWQVLRRKGQEMNVAYRALHP